ncbi:PAB-dependent poly(A)-specific ribonuclease subunit PAN3 [Apiospora arundinis]|uniref:PAB-dependent poly(A)-specific ribonuclease subunit PAN3 n=1 Tax=Apiospora arundinis TaxID=335852 RepID=A0ABR2IIM2_9PEZI
MSQIASMSKEEVADKVREFQPDILFSASMWRAEDASDIQQTARSIKPDTVLHAIPFGLQVDKGPDAIVEHLLEQIPRLLG